jgi:CPA2 family monovalent cation:H+ antiporter-2
MIMDSFLGQAIIYLGAAIICVPLAKRLGMGSVLGYLAAGIIIGPFCLGFIGAEGQDVMHFAEFGVVMMLFLVGLELEPTHFWGMRKFVVGLGSLQVVMTTLAVMCATTLMGFSWQAALATGLALSMSSTAMVLQSLKEKGIGQTEAGRSCLAVLLFQDIAVIPVLAFLPFLALQKGVSAAAEPGSALLAALPGWVQASSVLFAILLVIFGGRYVIVPFLRTITRTRLRELCIAAALLIIAATAYLMKIAGLSPALGTFLAGVVLANSEFRHELESDIEPFKGLLLGLFFIAVGASVNFRLILNDPAQIMAMLTALLVIKTAVMLALGRLFKLSFDQNCIFSLALSQVGEFAFVLFAFINRLQILEGPWVDTMIALTALSMTFTPLLLLINERFILPHFGTRERQDKEADAIDTAHPVIIAGFSFFGSIIGRFLRASGIESTILDNDSDRVDLLRKTGFKVFYGDATRLDILQSAGAATARVLVIAIDDPAINYALAETVKKNFPHLTVLARARNNPDAYELLDLGLQHIYRDCLDTALRASVDLLVLLGLRRFSATRAAQNFIKYDEATLRHLAPHRHDEKTFIYNSKEQIRMQEELLAHDRRIDHSLYDHAWDSARLSCTVNADDD